MTSNLFDLSGKHIVLTGGLGLLGLEYSKALQEHGARLFVIDVCDPTEAQRILRKHFSREDLKDVEYYKGDVTDKESLLSIREDILRKTRKIDVLVNNAAMNPKAQSASPVTYFNLEEWEKGLRTNLTGTALSADVFKFGMKTGASIINCASIYGLLGPDQGIYDKPFVKPSYYSASKGGVIALTKYLATLWGGEGIRVNCLVLGGVKHMQSGDFVRRYSEKVPIRRMARPHEFNGMVVYLASDASAYASGAVFTIDGGYSAW